jgi:hypothetical protein
MRARDSSSSLQTSVWSENKYRSTCAKARVLFSRDSNIAAIRFCSISRGSSAQGSSAGGASTHCSASTNGGARKV